MGCGCGDRLDLLATRYPGVLDSCFIDNGSEIDSPKHVKVRGARARGPSW